ncbi:hypothetical protein LBMAG42_52950 [Deltaproteobacteria bacterium]|nr:hypothetical protein LBMAG42_52950 [Deltaproteobacteria bacterium]
MHELNATAYGLPRELRRTNDRYERSVTLGLTNETGPYASPAYPTFLAISSIRSSTCFAGITSAKGTICSGSASASSTQ